MKIYQTCKQKRNKVHSHDIELAVNLCTQKGGMLRAEGLLEGEQGWCSLCQSYLSPERNRISFQGEVAVTQVRMVHW